MKKPKIPVGLVSALLKVHKGKNPTFLGKLGFSDFLRISNILHVLYH